MKTLNEIRAEHNLPPLPPMDRFYRNWTLQKKYTEVKFQLNSKTMKGDMLKLEIAWRAFKRTLRTEFRFLEPILNYFK